MWELLKATGAGWVAHKDARLGAALAYYSIFSLGPIIVIAIAIAGLFFQREVIQGEVSSVMQGMLGENGARAVETMLAGATTKSEGLAGTIIGVATLLFAAIGLVVQLKDALNTVWEVEATRESGVWSFVRTYILSFAGVVSVGFLLVISLMLTTLLALTGKAFGNVVPEWLLQPLSSAVSFSVIALVFGLMFKWLPDAEIAWQDVWMGAVATAFLFEAGKFLIGIYIGKQGLESNFGAAASLVVVLIWVYYSAQIVLLGAEFTRAYSRSRASKR